MGALEGRRIDSSSTDGYDAGGKSLVTTHVEGLNCKLRYYDDIGKDLALDLEEACRHLRDIDR